MPPPSRKKSAKPVCTVPVTPVKISAGAGITAGLELWRLTPTGPFVLADRSADGRFATDVATWNAGATDLTPAALDAMLVTG
jgi:hypothetical protein